jgi:hypothetical protein
MTLQSFPIVGLTKGLQTNVKPAMLPDQAWSLLYNAYTYRERELKREGRKLLGRLRRMLTDQSLGTTSAGTTFTLTDIFTTLSIPELQAEMEVGSLVITVGAPDTATFTDNGNGTFTVTGSGVSAGSYINYTSGKLVLNFTSLTGGATVTANFNYFPTLPVMGIPSRDLPTINDEQTIWFDQTYAYIWNGSGFQEFIPGTTWTGSNSNFFWPYNYRGANAYTRLFFVTNNNIGSSTYDPIRYTDGVTWTDFQPIILDNPPSAAQSLLYQCLIIIAYYGRLLAFNTWEGTTAGGSSGAQNYFNRCRFSALGDPTASQAWRSDVFGQGGLIDAPTNEAITGATFIKNTLVVDFERSTWQLRYVGEYGLPFIWERISADYGSESTFSGVLFDNHRLAVGDKGITAATGNGVDRIDLAIPDEIFQFKNANNGVQRVFGIRDFKRELVFWNFANAQTQTSNTQDIVFPNNVLVYNYRNQSWAIFRDSITAFGNFQSTTNITWSSETVFWSDWTVLWSDAEDQSLFNFIVCGNQQGFVSMYGYPSPSNISTVQANDQETLTITAMNLSATPIIVKSVNHNLQNGEIVYLSNMNFLNSTTFAPVTSSLNNSIFKILVIDANTFSIQQWNFAIQDYVNGFPFTPSSVSSTYVGGGRITLFPKMNLLTKDINIFQGKSLQTKLSRLDFLIQSVTNGQITIKLFLNASSNVGSIGIVGEFDLDTVGNNNLVWKGPMSIDASPPFYTPNSDYSWFRFFATLSAQYFQINITYDDNQMNTFATHSQSCTLYGINAWCRAGGKNTF